MSKAKRVFFFGPLPPPTHGMAVVNAQMVALLQRHCEVIIGNTSPESLNRGAVYHARKAVRVLSIIARLPVARAQGTKSLYGSPDDGWGGIWTLAILLTARLLAMRVTLHYHSFRYLVKRSYLMAYIVRAAGASAKHVVLGGQMAQLFVDKYPRARNIIIAENSVAFPPSKALPDRTGELTLGILANLTAEKGALDFIATVAAALNEGLPITAVLAGPIADERVSRALDEAVTKYPGKVSFLGPVSGAEKERFFAEIDLFLFPTRYRTEAFPLVLMESLVRGVTVAAYDRGCIGQLVGQHGVTLVPADDDFITPSLQLIRNMVRDGRPDRSEIAKAALARNANSLADLEKLAASICAGSDSVG